MPNEPISLTTQALDRLRKLADGNGMMPDDISLVEAEEKVYAIEASTHLDPACEVQAKRYTGKVHGKDRQILPNFSALHQAAQRFQQEFQTGSDWIQPALDELKAATGHGWGLDGAKIVLSEKSVILAASEACFVCQGRQLLTCSQCQGQGFVVCGQCQGRKEELCYMCNGTGENPQNPRQPCLTCHGRRVTHCRFCRSTGQLTCPTCAGRRGTTCTSCNGAGSMTEEIALTCTATTHFKLDATGLPSGLRQGLDRLGIANLAKGHATIEIVLPQKNEKPPHDGEPREEQPKPVLNYRAKLPYADLKIRFGTYKTALVTSFGKRGALLNVPAFLDETLKPWHEKLQLAARGEASLEQATEARAIHEALKLELEGKGRVNELRRIYNVGLSPDVAQKILTHTRQAVKLITLRVRRLTAIGCGILSTVLFGGIFLTPLNARLTQSLFWGTGLALDLALPAIVLLLSWLALSFSTRIVLQKQFPDFKIPLPKNTGKTGYTMLGFIGVVYVACFVLAPVKPVWLLHLLR